MTIITSINESKVDDILLDLEMRLLLVDFPTHQIILDSECSWNNDDEKNVDLATIALYLKTHKEFIAPIFGGKKYLDHVSECKSCLYNLKTPLGEFPKDTPEDFIIKVNYNFAETITRMHPY